MHKILYIGNFGHLEADFFKINKDNNYYFLFFTASYVKIFKGKKKLFQHDFNLEHTNIFLIFYNFFIICKNILFTVLRFGIKNVKVKGVTYATFICLLKSVNIIRNFDYLCDDWYITNSEFNKKKIKVFVFLELLVKKRARKIYSVSEKIYLERLSFFKKNKVLISNEFILPIYYTRKKLKKKNNSKKIIFGTIGSIRQAIDFKLIFNFIHRFQKYNNKQIMFHFVGSFENEHYLNLKKKLSVFKNIKFTNFIKNEKKFEKIISEFNVGFLFLNEKSYSSNLIPSKIINFLISGIPIIFKSNKSFYSNFILKNKIGIGLDLKNLGKGFNILKNYSYYKKNINNLANKVHQNKKNFVQFFID